MNLPNALTVLRILLIPFFIGFLTYGHYLWALWTILIAGVTDILDGVIARMANQRTKLGAYLDPLADKLLLTASFITLSILHLVLALVLIAFQKDVHQLMPLLALMLTLTVISGLHYVYRGIRAYHPDLV